ncbi:MAG TPA: helix-turn-helix domain-containing protein [Pseudolabrys sp.]|nr:helix-turn-helix domain-containing protein [Pseudolabrys sp.]
MNNDPAPQTLIPLIVADLFELAGAFRDHGEGIAQTVGQTQARWQVMSAASGGTLTVPQIARRLGVSRQNVQRIADLLVDEGSAAFAGNPDHKASPYLALSKGGHAALAGINKAAAAYHARIARRLAGADIKSLHRQLRRLLEAAADTP